MLVHLGIIGVGSVHDKFTKVPQSRRYRPRKVSKVQQTLYAMLSMVITVVLTMLMIALFVKAVTVSYNAGKTEWQRQEFGILIDDIRSGLTRLF